MKENKTKPDIRFKGFTEAWEQRKLGDVANRFDNLRIPVASNLRVSGLTPYYGANGIQDYVEGYTHDGEFVLIAEDGANDLKNYPVYYVNGRIWVNNHAHVLQGIEKKCHNSFLAYNICQLDIEPFLVGGGRAKLNADVMMKLYIYLPKFDEQTKIGQYFLQLDNLITLHQRECDQLKELKKSMLKKLFPRDGSNIPEVRFAGFTDAWEQRKLKEITDSYSGGTPSAGKKEYYDGSIPFIRSGEISDDKTELFITEDGLNNSSAKIVHEGDILYALYGATSGEVSISKLKGAINQAILAIQPHDEYNRQFLMQWLRKSKDNIVGTYLQGGQGNLSGNIIKELIVNVPTYDEQNKIGEYFEQLDNLITLHQRELEILKNLKKTCLKRMFI